MKKPTSQNIKGISVLKVSFSWREEEVANFCCCLFFSVICSWWVHLSVSIFLLLSFWHRLCFFLFLSMNISFYLYDLDVWYFMKQWFNWWDLVWYYSDRWIDIQMSILRTYWFDPISGITTNSMLPPEAEHQLYFFWVFPNCLRATRKRFLTKKNSVQKGYQSRSFRSTIMYDGLPAILLIFFSLFSSSLIISHFPWFLLHFFTQVSHILFFSAWFRRQPLPHWLQWLSIYCFSDWTATTVMFWLFPFGIIDKLLWRDVLSI